jgi:hypothetical protein
MANTLWLWAQRTLWRQWRWYSGQGDACWVGEKWGNDPPTIKPINQLKITYKRVLKPSQIPLKRTGTSYVAMIGNAELAQQTIRKQSGLVSKLKVNDSLPIHHTNRNQDMEREKEYTQRL